MKYKRPSIEIACEVCGAVVVRERRMVSRAKREGRKITCSHACARPRSDKFGFYHWTTRKRAKIKNLEFNLTTKFLEKLFQEQQCKCALTGIEMTLNSIYSKEKSLFHASLDRLDNSKGYTQDNVQFVCLGINYMRNSVSLNHVKEFLSSLR